MYLEHPLVALADKQTAAKKVFNFCWWCNNQFFTSINWEKWISCIDAIIKKFTSSLSDSMKISIARVTSAVPLTNAQRKLISKSKEYCNATEVKLLCSVDSEILAGLKVQVNSQVLDLSVEGQMKNLVKYFGLGIQLS